MKAKAFDRKFDETQENILDDLDLTQIRRPGHEQRRIDVDFPVGMIDAPEREAMRLGVSRQSIIKIWIVERLEHAPGL